MNDNAELNDLESAGNSTSEAKADLSTVQSVDKALMVIELLMRRGESLSAREIALRTGINRTTGHRLLNALMHRGWIEKETNSASYRVSLRFLVLSNLAYQQRDVLTAMRPALQKLSDLSRETVHVGVLDGFDLIHVDKIDSPERVGVSSKIGTRAYPHAAALGKAILASSTSDIVSSYTEYATRLPAPDTLTDAQWLFDEIDRTRLRGYAVDDEEDSIGVRCIGSAIIAGNGEPVFAISITGPSGRFTMEQARKCAPALIETAATLSRDFGWDARSRDSARSSAAGK